MDTAKGPKRASERADGIVVRVVPGTDPVLLRVRDLCYETLHRPFGVSRDDAWNETDPRSTHFVAMDGDRVVGYVRLMLEAGGGHVRQVSVDPAYRFRGIATSLLDGALAHAREIGLPFVFLHARERAVGLYQRAGFRITEGPFRMGRTYLPHVRMELSLDG